MRSGIRNGSSISAIAPSRAGACPRSAQRAEIADATIEKVDAILLYSKTLTEGMATFGSDFVAQTFPEGEERRRTRIIPLSMR